MAKTCVICGKPSGMYPLCREHLQMKADGKVIKCEDCGTWHLANEPCQPNFPNRAAVFQNLVFAYFHCRYHPLRVKPARKIIIEEL